MNRFTLVAALVFTTVSCRTVNLIPEYRDRIHRVSIHVVGKPNVRVDLGQSTQKDGIANAFAQAGAAAVNLKLSTRMGTAVPVADLKRAAKDAAEYVLRDAGIDLVDDDNADAIFKVELRGYGVLADSPESYAEGAVDVGSELHFSDDNKLLWEGVRSYSRRFGTFDQHVRYTVSNNGMEFDKLIRSEVNITKLLLMSDEELHQTFMAYTFEATWEMMESLARGLHR